MRGAALSVIGLTLIAPLVPASRVEAATIPELQAQIQALLQELNMLKQTTPIASACSIAPIGGALGERSNAVMSLQKFLISRGHTIPAGATGYFGPQTKSALLSFQTKEGVAPSGLFDAATRARAETLCAPLPIPVPQPTPTPIPNTPPTLSGEATLTDFNTKSGDDTSLEEGQKNMSVMDVSFNVQDGDARIDRIDLAVTPQSDNTEKDPWDTFTTMSVYQDSKRIAQIDGSKKSNWTKNEPNDGSYRIRFTGTNMIVRNDDTVNLTIKTGTARSIKGTEDGEGWDIFVPTNGIRATDADRVSIYTGDSADTVQLDIDKAGRGDELTVKRSNDDPDATTIALKEHGTTSWTTLSAFDLDTNKSTNDITVRSLPVTIAVSSGTVETFVKDVRLVVGNTIYTNVAITDGTTSAVVFDFDRHDFVIPQGDTVTVKLQASFRPLSPAYEGTTIVGSVDVSHIDAEGADTLEGSQLRGSATGETHTLRTSGAIVPSENTAVAYKANTNMTLTDDEGVFTVKFSVTAFDKDIYIARDATRGTVLSTGGVNYVIKDSSNGSTETASGTVVAILDSDARVQDGFYIVREGDTKSFTLTIEYDPEYKSFYKLGLYSLNWNDTASDPTVQQRTLPEQNFMTPSLSISN